MAHPEPRGLLPYLEEVGRLRHIAGLEERARQSRVRSRRTVYRWRQHLNGALHIIPSVALEELGLVHLHLIVHRPSASWLRLPYAVEHAWLSADLLENALYLHCLIPAVHEQDVRALLGSLQSAGSCRSITMLVSGGPRQELRLTNTAAPADVLRALPASSGVAILRECPLIVPVVCESWQGEECFAKIWEQICTHAKDAIRGYVPRGRYTTNGKTHVKAAWDVLDRAGLFEHYVVRYERLLHRNLEVFLVVRRSREWLAELLETLRPVSCVVEAYGEEHGAALVRATGGRDLLDALMAYQAELVRHGTVVYVRNTHRSDTVRVRFCYEFLFNPRTASWEFPKDAIMAHLQAPP